MLEKTIVNNIRKMLTEEFPGINFKTHGSGYQRTGLSDIIACHKGRFIAIEVKTPKTKNNLSELQKKFLRDVKEAGGIAFAAWSVEMTRDILKEELKNETRTIKRVSTSRQKKK